MEKINNFFTDKGSVSVKVRNSLKLKQIPLIKNALEKGYSSVMLGNDGAYYIPVGEANGSVIYARLELTISVKNPKAE
jgi:hypothetical protein